MYILLDDKNVVIQTQPNEQEGFIKCDNYVVCGMLYDGDVFKAPEPEPASIQQQIDELEDSVTSRNIRGAIAGIQYDIDAINKINAEIAVLALEL